MFRRIILILLAVFFAVCIVAFTALMLAGSIEMYPAPEQISGGRMVWGMLLLPVCIGEGIVLTRLFRKK